MARRKGNLKKFNGFIEGDGALRKAIFREKSASQQTVFELFSHLDHTHYGFFLYFAAVPSTAFWDILLSRLSAVASGASRNRNFCEDYGLLGPVVEQPSRYPRNRDKTLNLVGASHALWWELADPRYDEQPNAHGIWMALMDLNPSRTVWEWWFEQRAVEAERLWAEHRDELHEPWAEAAFEDWATEHLGLKAPRRHWYGVTRQLIDSYREATRLKHRITLPYLRGAYTIAKSIAAYNQPGLFLDTVNVASAGLMRSIAKYAPSMARAFGNFCDREIRYEVYYQICATYNMIILPNNVWRRHKEFDRYRRDFVELYGRDPTMPELAAHFEMPVAEIHDILQLVASQIPQSIDQKVFPDDDSNYPVTLKDRLEDPQEVEARESSEDREQLLQAMQQMAQRERKLFAFSHGLFDLLQDLEPARAEVQEFFMNRVG
jgi:DNA-directed RNA polymerase specialized sigma subunit